MALSEDANVTVRARMKRDPALCQEVLKEAIAVLIAGEVDVGKTLLRNYVIARLGFDELGRLTGKAPQSLMRMLSRTGNPQARNLLKVVRVLQEHEGVQSEVRFKRRPAEAA
jgi:DNA-binding phage protein